jgi:hypothetical protein
LLRRASDAWKYESSAGAVVATAAGVSVFFLPNSFLKPPPSFFFNLFGEIFFPGAAP